MSIHQHTYHKAQHLNIVLLCVSPDTVEPVSKDRHIAHKNMVSQDGRTLVTGSFYIEISRTFCQNLLVLQDRSLIAVVFKDRFHCTPLPLS